MKVRKSRKASDGYDTTVETDGGEVLVYHSHGATKKPKKAEVEKAVSAMMEARAAAEAAIEEEGPESGLLLAR